MHGQNGTVTSRSFSARAPSRRNSGPQSITQTRVSLCPIGMAALQRKLVAKTRIRASDSLWSTPRRTSRASRRWEQMLGERISPDSKQQSVNMLFTCGGPASRLSSTLSNASHKKWRFANAWPEPDFRYLSNRAATASVLNSTHTSTTHGFQRAVDGF